MIPPAVLLALVCMVAALWFLCLLVVVHDSRGHIPGIPFRFVRFCDMAQECMLVTMMAAVVIFALFPKLWM